MSINSNTQVLELYFSPTSPYARKCRIILLEKGLQERVKLTVAIPSDNPPELVEANPLGTVPALRLSPDEVLCESPVICEFLDSLSSSRLFYPIEQSARFQALALAALADGIMDASVTCVLESRRPKEKYYSEWVDRKEKAILRTLKSLEKHNLSDDYPWQIGSMSLAVALEFLNFRLNHLQWQDEHPALAQWLAAVSRKPSMRETAPSNSV